MTVDALPVGASALDALAAVLEYPRDGFAARVRDAQAAVAAILPAAADGLEAFRLHVEASAVDALEEGYTRTFDWSPTCCLEVGWHLFGEQYDRGSFMVAMRERLRACGVEEGTDLPDHLGSCLRWLGRAPASEARTVASQALLPALAKIRAGLAGDPPPGVAPYATVIRAVEDVVRALAEEETVRAGDVR